ncbi:uncharacterized protein BJ171DRAFT_27604 [Polychytrium aggregatum]|uniref:uncharacterized protein n=1 Tax=Polychytrium aggregatum TaxID=110093 RepID=UPI0022FE4949|nr:uncharacterized protein BJ171DRAFT_27604 [Polychytrium aggregatum]KAI9206264.1 hypothetical protein BJ171DRAFT_27604 [Polychytrium aggregatum]
MGQHGLIRLTSLTGLPNVPMLLELDISTGIETFVNIPEEFPSLTKLTISSHKPHNILSQLPRMPKLNHLVLSAQFVSLADLHVNRNSLKVLDLQACCELMSLDDIPSYPKLEALYVPRSIRRISGLVDKLPSLKTLHLDSSMRPSRCSFSDGKYGRYADYFRLRKIISGLPKGCRVVFNNSFEYTLGRFSRSLGMELPNVMC